MKSKLYGTHKMLFYIITVFFIVISFFVTKDPSPLNIIFLTIASMTWSSIITRLLFDSYIATAQSKMTNNRPNIVCLCGSTRFGETFRKVQLEQTLAGNIVLTIGCNMRSDAEIFSHYSQSELDSIKAKLDELHLRKIDLADEVIILNVGGYIGSSTRKELKYALKLGKPVKFLETIDTLLDKQAMQDKEMRI